MPADAKPAVTEALRTAILASEFAPNQRLVEIDLCERFGTSRFILRAALAELAARGLVEFQRNRGARVRDVPLAEAIEITEVRIRLEGMAAARAAERITESGTATLLQTLKDMRTAVRNSELLRYSELNAQLHGAIRDAAAHETVSVLLRQLRDQTVRYRFSLSLVPGRPAVSLPQHEAIVAAVTARDPRRAEAAMRRHLESVLDAYRALSRGASTPRETGGC